MSKKTWKEEFYPIPADEVPLKRAVAHSLKKWRGLLPRNLKKHGLKEAPIEFGMSSTCALCVNYTAHPASGDMCDGCPLFEIGHECQGQGSPYDQWATHDDPRPMIAALRVAKEWEKRRK